MLVLVGAVIFCGYFRFSGLELLQHDPQARNFQDLQELQVVTFWCVLSLMVNYFLLQQFNSREDARAGYEVQLNLVAGGGWFICPNYLIMGRSVPSNWSI